MVILLNFNVVNIHNFIRRNQEIHANIEVRPINTSWLFLSIYASTNIDNRNTVWNNIENIHESYNSPWLLGGDFNDIFSRNAKFGGNPINRKHNTRLWASINKCNLVDLGYKGFKYTWSNHIRKSRGLIMEN